MMNIGRNVGFGLRQRGVDAAEIKERVGRVLERVGLPGVENRQVDQLSGGQKQRVAIARCMVLEPDVLLLDEPLGALDLKLREHMKIELKSLQAEFNTTFVYITHDQSEALVMSDNIAVMNKGRFDQVGTAKDLYYEPANAFVAGFVGDANKFEGTITMINGDPIDHPNARAHIVDSVLFNGANSLVVLRDPKSGETIKATLPQIGDFLRLSKGETVFSNWHPQQARCFAIEDS